MRFTNKNIFVTGGNSGIGLATARAFAAEGGRVAITGRNVDTLQAARATLSDGSMAIVSDAGSLNTSMISQTGFATISVDSMPCSSTPASRSSGRRPASTNAPGTRPLTPTSKAPTS